MRFRTIAILAIASLAAACGPPSQSLNPAALQSAAVSSGRVSPDNRCNYLKMEPFMKTIRSTSKWESRRSCERDCGLL